MSAVVRTLQCYPEDIDIAGIVTGTNAPADHEHCPGGHHMPGVLGGWHCPCPCHHAGVHD